jgi:hypothetical protein
VLGAVGVIVGALRLCGESADGGSVFARQAGSGFAGRVVMEGEPVHGTVKRAREGGRVSHGVVV